MSDVFFNGKFVGIVENGAEFAKKLIEERRKGKLSKYLSVQYRKTLDTVYLALDGGRILRPLIVVKDGKPLLTEQHIKALQSGEASWSDLVKNGIIEFLDAAEEENAYVALSEEELTPKHTHLEINPVAIFGITTSLVPFANYIQSSKLNRGQKVQKQAMGGIKTDATVNLLHYPQVPIVQTFTQELIGREHAAGQNVVMAIINYDGYGMSDALLINAGSLQRGLGRSTYFRTYTTEKLRYPGGQIDEIGIPGKDVQGYTVEHDYRHLEQDGLARVGAEVFGGDVIIGKTSPPRFLGKLDVFSSAANIKKDTSERVRYGEKGIVNKVVITESEEGTPRIKVEVRETRIPEVGDKWSTKHGQKGILSRIVPEEDMPFTSTGIKPDIIFSPNGLPKRMTVSHMLEAL
ncbi:MAG: DNA-directed RNA polymerase subunit B, partial [Fervidobacterium sp.]